MAELSTSLADKSRSLAAMRLDVFETCRRHGSAAIGLRHMVIAAAWADQRAADLMDRRARLLGAETALLWQLQTQAPPEQLRPQLRSRSPEIIEAELEAAFESLAWLSNGTPDTATRRVELRAAELTYELAVAQRDQYLLAIDLPRSGVVHLLTEVIDYLGYQIARSRPRPQPDWSVVTAATENIRRLLDESWLADVGRGDLLAIQQVLTDLDPPEIDEVIARLSTDELYRWFHEFDGVRGGNLSPDEESNLFELIAARAGAETLFALAGAEAGARFHQIAAAVRRVAPTHVALEFIEICAAAAASSDDALVTALAGMAHLDSRHRTVLATSLSQQGLLDPLAEATERLIRRQSIERDSPIVVEFFEGLVGALGTAVTTLAELSIVGLVDRHTFREAWSNVGGVIGLAFTDPVSFVEVVLDLETLRRNPARWTGAAASDLASFGVGRLARLGRLGRLARTAAHWLKQAGSFVILDTKRISLRARHVTATLEEIAAATSAAAIAAALEGLAAVETYISELDQIITGLAEASADDITLWIEVLEALGVESAERFLEAMRAAAESAAA